MNHELCKCCDEYFSCQSTCQDAIDFKGLDESYYKKDKPKTDKAVKQIISVKKRFSDNRPLDFN